MGEVVQLQTIEQRATEAWEEYCSRVAIVNADMTLDNGIAAGRAWARFLDLFGRLDRPSAKEEPKA
ncbi:hypothetical protein NKH47_01910 [Mesorhizobium sp. M1060]|uniref:hypothetical protein n=1 Tax=Mesorhizobium sp. M1060 TaxID=2957052 RepID=UPI0033382E13